MRYDVCVPPFLLIRPSPPGMAPRLELEDRDEASCRIVTCIISLECPPSKLLKACCCWTYHQGKGMP